MRNPPDIVQAIRHDKIFKPLFGDLTTWSAWLVFLKAVFGLPMDQSELELYRKCTARSEPPVGGVKESYAIVGRRGGKSRIVSVAAVYIACFHDFTDYLSVGERGMVLILARDRDQAKVCFSYISGILQSVPALSQMVSSWRADEIELTNRIVVSVKTADYRAVRGVTVVCCIADEVCFWDSQGVSPDREIFQAIRPAMATVPTAKLLVISSPYSKDGVVFEAHHDHFGRSGSPVLVWQAATTLMNPLISDAFVETEIEKDPEAARSEWLAQFREDIEAAFSLESIEQCVIPGRTELLPAQDVPYRCFVDPSGGRRDHYAVAVAHRHDDKAVVDLVASWRPPFDPAEITKQCCEVVKPYRIQMVVGDAYAGEWPREQFRKHDVEYGLSDKNKSELYLSLIPVVNSKRVELPDNRRMIEELRRLERRRGRSGKDSVDHPQYGGTDDVANAVAGSIHLALAQIVDTEHLIAVGQRRIMAEGSPWANGNIHERFW